MVTWTAKYKDGKVIEQDVNGGSYDDLPDKDNIVEFMMMHVMDHPDKPGKKLQYPVFTLHLDEPGKKLIWRRRWEIVPGMGQQICHLVGTRRLVGGEVVQNLCYIFEAYDKKTGEEIRPFIHVAGKFDRTKVGAWMRDIKLKTFETVTDAELVEVKRREAEEAEQQRKLEEARKAEEAEKNGTG